MICQAGIQWQYPYLFHFYNIRFCSWQRVRLPVMLHRGGEQGGADGLGVITAQDEKEEERRQWGIEGRRGAKGRCGCQMDDKKKIKRVKKKDCVTYRNLTSSSLCEVLNLFDQVSFIWFFSVSSARYQEVVFLFVDVFMCVSFLGARSCVRVCVCLSAFALIEMRGTGSERGHA